MFVITEAAPAAMPTKPMKLSLDTQNTRCDRQLSEIAGVGRVVVDVCDHRSSASGDADGDDEGVVGHATCDVIASQAKFQIVV